MRKTVHSPDLSPTLRSAALFKGLSEAEIRTILKAGSMCDYKPEQWLYTQGRPARNFFLLESGVVSLSELMPEGEETLFRFVLPGEPFGWVSLAGAELNVLSAQAVQQSRTICWTGATVLNLLRQIPGSAANLLSTMIHDVVFYYHHTRRLRTSLLARRIAWAVRELIRAFGKPTKEGILIENVKQRQLADLAGTTVYSVSRELGRLQRQGVLRKQRGRMVVLRPDKL